MKKKEKKCKRELPLYNLRIGGKKRKDYLSFQSFFKSQVAYKGVRIRIMMSDFTQQHQMVKDLKTGPSKV